MRKSDFLQWSVSKSRLLREANCSAHNVRHAKRRSETVSKRSKADDEATAADWILQSMSGAGEIRDRHRIEEHKLRRKGKCAINGDELRYSACNGLVKRINWCDADRALFTEWRWRPQTVAAVCE